MPFSGGSGPAATSGRDPNGRRLRTLIGNASAAGLTALERRIGRRLEPPLGVAPAPLCAALGHANDWGDDARRRRTPVSSGETVESTLMAATVYVLGGRWLDFSESAPGADWIQDDACVRSGIDLALFVGVGVHRSGPPAVGPAAYDRGGGSDQADPGRLACGRIRGQSGGSCRWELVGRFGER